MEKTIWLKKINWLKPNLTTIIATLYVAGSYISESLRSLILGKLNRFVFATQSDVNFTYVFKDFPVLNAIYSFIFYYLFGCLVGYLFIAITKVKPIKIDTKTKVGFIFLKLITIFIIILFLIPYIKLITLLVK
mgnify:CR=1 FL=1